ncbi:MAG: stage IV sporulation protein A [Bacillota bacterium]
MEKYDLFKDIAERTGGDIYIGAAGPVRGGKSTFIRNFMELLVLDNILDEHERERARDSLPQAAAGRTIMTVEPKFIPDDGVEIRFRDNITLRVRMVDCTGYIVEGALGFMEADGPRMVRTPWFEEEIPFEQAAEIGTRKVITEHSTIGLVITTDGSFGEIPRSSYVPAETRAINELKELGKPFVVVLNTTQPYARATTELAGELEILHDVPVIPVDCKQMTESDVFTVLEQVLYEFPVREVNINLPRWLEELESRHWLRNRLEENVRVVAGGIKRLRDIDRAMHQLQSSDLAEQVVLSNMDMGTGVATINLAVKEELFFEVLGEIAGFEIADHRALLRTVRDCVAAKEEFDHIKKGLEEARDMGYGMVLPRLEELVFEEPEMVRQGNRFGVRLKASAPSLHLIRADVSTEVTPIIGTEKQGEELVNYLLDKFEDDPKKIWESDIFGKPLKDLVEEGIHNKLFKMPENAQHKLQETLTRIVNEGSGGLICIII